MKNVTELTDKELMYLAISFALKKAPRKEDGLTISAESFQRTKATFLICVKYLRDNYKGGSELEPVQAFL